MFWFCPYPISFSCPEGLTWVINSGSDWNHLLNPRLVRWMLKTRDYIQKSFDEEILGKVDAEEEG